MEQSIRNMLLSPIQDHLATFATTEGDRTDVLMLCAGCGAPWGVLETKTNFLGQRDCFTRQAQAEQQLRDYGRRHGVVRLFGVHVVAELRIEDRNASLAATLHEGMRHVTGSHFYKRFHLHREARALREDLVRAVQRPKWRIPIPADDPSDPAEATLLGWAWNVSAAAPEHG